MHQCFPTPRALRALLLPAALAAMLFGSSGWADDPNGYTPTLHREYQAVFEDGDSSWWSDRPFPRPGGVQPPGYPIEMTGVVINNPWDMLYYLDTSDDWPAFDPLGPYDEESPQWQVFFQATEDAKTEDDDFGGTAMYMRRHRPFGDKADLYPGDAWSDEMDRLNFPVYEVTGEPVTEPLQRGDLIKVEAKAPGMEFRGKNNINTRHTSDPDNAFSITILQRGVPLEAPLITLADLKDANDDFIFGESRQYGCEHYQGSLVRLEHLYLQEPEDGVEWGDYWSLYNTVTVLQNGLTFPMQLGLDPALADFDPRELEEKGFHVTAILNQEAKDFPYTDTYSLWLTNAMDLTVVPEPGTAMLVAFGAIACLLLPRRRRWR